MRGNIRIVASSAGGKCCPAFSSVVAEDGSFYIPEGFGHWGCQCVIDVSVEEIPALYEKEIPVKEEAVQDEVERQIPEQLSETVTNAIESLNLWGDPNIVEQKNRDIYARVMPYIIDFHKNANPENFVRADKPGASIPETLQRGFNALEEIIHIQNRGLNSPADVDRIIGLIENDIGIRVVPERGTYEYHQFRHEIKHLDFANTDPAKVFNNTFVSVYDGQLVLRVDIGRSMSLGVMFLDHSLRLSEENIYIVKHERGHLDQLNFIGLENYLHGIAIPSVLNPGGYTDRRYFLQPWEFSADLFGVVSMREGYMLDYYTNYDTEIESWAYLVKLKTIGAEIDKDTLEGIFNTIQNRIQPAKPR